MYDYIKYLSRNKIHFFEVEEFCKATNPEAILINICLRMQHNHVSLSKTIHVRGL